MFGLRCATVCSPPASVDAAALFQQSSPTRFMEAPASGSNRLTSMPGREARRMQAKLAVVARATKKLGQ
jgi:hypothetical protein